MSHPTEERMKYVARRKKLSGFLYETCLPNEYLVQLGLKEIKPVLGGKRFKWFKKFLRVPASVQTINFTTDNANVDFQGIGIDGYATWRIDPARPEKAMTTLDFFDENDPMARTNKELKAICIEAVRHVIANMTIDEALKKKAEIATALQNQLKETQENWGILFDQVGIEKVTIMSNSLFEELQSKYRDRLRLDVQKTKLQTDHEIAAEQNEMKEKIELETLETEKKIEMAKNEAAAKTELESLETQRRVEMVKNQTREKTKLESLDTHKRIKTAENETRETTELGTLETERKLEQAKNESEEKSRLEIIESEHRVEMLENENHAKSKIATLDEERNIAEKEREIKEALFRNEAAFRKDQEQLNHDIDLLAKNLKLQLQDSEIRIHETHQKIESINSAIQKEQLDLEKFQHEITQILSPEMLSRDLIEALPKVFQAIKIDNYSVLDTGNGDGSSAAAPITRFIKELLFMLQDSDFSIFKNGSGAGNSSDSGE